MKKVFRFTVGLFVVLFFSMGFHQFVKAETLGTISPTVNTAGYEEIDGKKLGVATFLKGFTYEYSLEDDENYYVPFGNDVLSIPKVNAAISEGNLMSFSAKSVSTVKTTKRTIVKSESNQNIGFISSDVRVPIIEEKNNSYKLNFAGQVGYISKSDTAEDKGIPVLMYHHMVENRLETPHVNNRMVIDVKQFGEEIQYLKNNDWHTISLSDLQQWLLGNINLPAKTVVITFDDGITSTVKYAYPMLKDYEFKATSFTITGKIHQQAAPWDINSFQYVGLKEIKATSDIFDYQHHAFYMHNLTPGTSLGQYVTKSYDEILDDLEKGKTQLGKAFNGDTSHIKYLAYPFGHYNETTIAAAKAAGIEMAFTTEPGNVRMGDPVFALKRQGIAPEHTLKDFEGKLLGSYK